MGDMIMEKPHVIEEGFTPTAREYSVEHGFIDILGKDKELYTIGRKGYYYSTDTFGDNERVCTKGQIEFYILNLEVYKISFKHI